MKQVNVVTSDVKPQDEKTKKENRNLRTEMLIGSEALFKLQNSRVAVIGVGGVGGYALEALARAGVGEFLLVDSDRVAESNINRQIIATVKTVGQYKTIVAKERVLEINPEAKVETREIFYSEESASEINLSHYDYIVDAIDSVRAKVHLIASAKAQGVRIISAMGAGNKLDPTAFEVADISKTAVCPLAKAVRIALRKLGINHHKVVYSREEPVVPVSEVGERVPASISFVPSAMGLIIAGEVIKELAGII